MRFVCALLIVAACGGGSDEVCHPPATSGGGPAIDLDGPFCKHLSSYRLFTDEATQTADPALFPYDLNTPLFADYAQKRRWLYLPPGATATWKDPDSLDLPVGTVIVKTFSFLHDRRDPSQGEDLIETRLLIHRTAGWDAVSYTYDGGDDATIAVAGEQVPVSWIHDDGTMRSDNYTVPNKNQCITCHGEHDGVLGPLGPKARHMNRPQLGVLGAPNQLAALVAAGKLTGAPADMTTWPVTPVFDDPSTGTIEQRARGYLDVNCSHCHNPGGFARTSGVDFSVTSPTLESLGICKRPTAAGRGTGGLDFDILPGMPDQSIVVFRMSSTEADIKMPQIGRNLVHAEGTGVVRDWITSLSGVCM